MSPPPFNILNTQTATMTPLALTTKDEMSSNLTINPVKFSTKTTTLMPIGANQPILSTVAASATTLSGISNHTNSIPATLSLKTSDITSASCQTMPMPLNLHATASIATIQPQNGLKNGLKAYNG